MGLLHCREGTGGKKQEVGREGRGKEGREEGKGRGRGLPLNVDMKRRP